MTTAEPAAPAPAPRPLDEVMLAMDVVDTLRHRQLVVAEELQGEARDHALVERLRQIYTAQGIEVTDRILAEGVAALREDRFAFRPPPDTLAVRLARVYVQRGRWARRLLSVAVLAVVVWGAFQLLVVGPRDAVAERLQARHAAITTLSRDAAAQARADTLFAQGEGAMAAGDVGTAREAEAALAELQARLESAYTLRIVVDPNEASGVWRVPDANPAARNHYLIVEAIDERGQRVALEVTDEETGARERVTRYGLRVDEATFERVRADHAADGIIAERVVGTKERGDLDPVYTVPTTGGAITRW